MQLVFMVVLFGGLAYMFLTILRNQDTMLRTLREDNARLSERLFRLETLLSSEENPRPSLQTKNRNDSCMVQEYQQGSAAGTAHDAMARAMQNETIVHDSPLLSSGAATSRQRGWKRVLAAGLNRLPEKRQERELQAREMFTGRNESATENRSAGRGGELHLDWPEPTPGKSSGPSDKGMPELRL